MPASLPSDTGDNAANPALGKFVTFDPISGPKNSPLDARKITGWTAVNPMPVYANDPANLSTGALSTGIGFGVSQTIAGAAVNKSFPDGNFNDDYTPGVTKPDDTASADSTLLYIGGGRSAVGGAPNPFTAGFAILGAGAGGSRDAGTGPAYTGFPIKTVTVSGTPALPAGVIETGFVNRSGSTIPVGTSVFGSGTNASAAPTAEAEAPTVTVETVEEEEDEDDKPTAAKKSRR